MKRFYWLAALVMAAGGLASPAYAQQPTFDGGKAYEHVRQMVAIGPRPAGSPAIERTRAYITAQLKALGIPVTTQAFDARTPIGQIHIGHKPMVFE